MDDTKVQELLGDILPMPKGRGFYRQTRLRRRTCGLPTVW